MKALEIYKKYGTYIFLVILIAVFSIIAPGFLSGTNFINILRQVSIFGIVVTGVAMVMIGGGMDLSVGAQLAVDGMLAGTFMVTLGLLHGQWLPDSQTGLRAFPVSLIPFLLSVPGERFEYEMGVLLAAARRGLPMVPVMIRTIYENGNAGTHYRPLLDTLRINRLVFADFFRFSGVSLLSFALDQGFAWLFAIALAAAGVEQHGMIWTSGFAARFLSAVFNFSMNRTVVFRAQGGVMASAWRYALLCVAVIVLSNAGVSGLAMLHVPRSVAKFVCDVLLYFASFRIQSKFIFRPAPIPAV